MKKNRMKITVEKVILFLAAGFAAYNFGLAGGYIEGTWISIGGLIAGVVVNVSLAIAASRFGSLTGKNRMKQAGMAFATMMVLSPALVAPVIFYSLPDTFLGAWWLRALWSTAWPLVADLAIVLAGAVSGKGLIAVSDDGVKKSVAGAAHVRRSAKGKGKSSVGVRVVYPRRCLHCDAQIGSANAVGAHMKKHHPELCKPKSLAVALFSGGEK